MDKSLINKMLEQKKSLSEIKSKMRQNNEEKEYRKQGLNLSIEKLYSPVVGEQKGLSEKVKNIEMKNGNLKNALDFNKKMIEKGFSDEFKNQKVIYNKMIEYNKNVEDIFKSSIPTSYLVKIDKDLDYDYLASKNLLLTSYLVGKPDKIWCLIEAISKENLSLGGQKKCKQGAERDEINNQIAQNKLYRRRLNVLLGALDFTTAKQSGSNIDNLDRITTKIIDNSSKRNIDMARKIFNNLLEMKVSDKNYKDQYSLNNIRTS